jgi:Putative Actinobacterial Holin-X, holin superfamily III
MDETPAAELKQSAGEPGFATMVRQLGDDARAFAEAEARYIREAVGERASYGAPAIAMIVAAISLVAGALVFLLFGIMMVLAPRIGPGWSLIIVFVASLSIAALLGWTGTRRLRNAFKRPEDR